MAKELCDRALEDARGQLHPLLQNNELDRLDRRREFLQAFKSALEQRIGRGLALCQPAIQAVFRYDETRLESIEHWDGSVHLLVKVPRVSNAVQALAKSLDRSLVRTFKQLGWDRVQARPSILEVQQVTPQELRHRVGYGAMFCAVHTVPSRVWPSTRMER